MPMRMPAMRCPKKRLKMMTFARFQYCCFLVELMKCTSSIFILGLVLNNLMLAIIKEMMPITFVTSTKMVTMIIAMAET